LSRLGSALSAGILILALPLLAAGQGSPVAKGTADNGNKAKDTMVAKSTIIVDKSDDRLPPDSFVKLDEVPAMLEQEQPLYPEKDKVAGVTGKYWLKLLINKQGLVRQAIAIKKEGGSPALEESAINAALKWKFKAALSNGKPVACWVAIAVNFTLNDSAKGSTK
jgi:TonB family protein